jgi:hypothetical protein
MAAVGLAVAVLAAGCGGGDETSNAAPESTSVAGSTGASGAAGAVPDCVGAFNSTANDNLPRLARLAHEPGGEILVGTYSGEPFSAETYDLDFTDGDGREVEVAPGACVVTEVSEGFGTLYLFVIGDDADWHNLLVTDPDVPLADDPVSQVENVQTVELEDVEAPEVPRLIP